MWLTIGFACLGLFAVAMLMHRFTAEWKGVAGQHAGIGYEYRTYNGRSGRQIKVGMKVSRRYDFVMRRHTQLDRLLGRVGIDSDKRICHPAFDDSLVILSDDFTASQALAAAPGLSDRLLNLFNLGSPDTVRLVKLVCRRGRLWALVEDNAAERSEMEAFGDKALPVMAEFADILQRLEGSEHQQRPDRYAVPAVAFLLMATGFLTKGTLEWLSTGAELPDSSLLIQSIIFGSLVALALGSVTIRLMHYNFKNHKVFAELFFVGMLGASATIYADKATEYRIANGIVDAQLNSQQLIEQSS
ncbi:hypothetical protein [Thalassolituus sp.]|uniref:hypothetical protein n=1 Tax=Thalassolituus sp. TaxID=2030822 RepID=UPI0035116282